MRVSPTYLINIFNLFDELFKYLFRDTKLNCLLFCGLCSQLCQSLSVSCILCGIMWLPAFQDFPHLSSLCFKSAILLLCWKISAYLWTHRSTITSFADSVRSYRELVASSSVTMISTRVIAVFYMPRSFAVISFLFRSTASSGVKSEAQAKWNQCDPSIQPGLWKPLWMKVSLNEWIYKGFFPFASTVDCSFIHLAMLIIIDLFFCLFVLEGMSRAIPPWMHWILSLWHLLFLLLFHVYTLVSVSYLQRDRVCAVCKIRYMLAYLFNDTKRYLLSYRMQLCKNSFSLTHVPH